MPPQNLAVHWLPQGADIDDSVYILAWAVQSVSGLGLQRASAKIGSQGASQLSTGQGESTRRCLIQSFSRS